MPHHILFTNEKPAVAIGAAVNFIAHDLLIYAFLSSLATATGDTPA